MIVRELEKQERKYALDIIWSVFCMDVAKVYEQEGIDTFREYLKQENIDQLCDSGELLMFGVFEHMKFEKHNPIFRGFDDVFYVPHSRHTEVRAEDIRRVPELTLLSESPEAGVYLVMARNGREFFVTGHSEYSPDTLNTEYKRDVAKGLDINLPQNYYLNDDPNNEPLVRWRSHANLMFTNWLNYFVYQETPYDLTKIH